MADGVVQKLFMLQLVTEIFFSTCNGRLTNPIYSPLSAYATAQHVANPWRVHVTVPSN